MAFYVPEWDFFAQLQPGFGFAETSVEGFRFSNPPTPLPDERANVLVEYGGNFAQDFDLPTTYERRPSLKLDMRPFRPDVVLRFEIRGWAFNVAQPGGDPSTPVEVRTGQFEYAFYDGEDPPKRGMRSVALGSAETDYGPEYVMVWTAGPALDAHTPVDGVIVLPNPPGTVSLPIDFRALPVLGELVVDRGAKTVKFTPA